MLIKECLLSVFCIHENSESCSVVSNQSIVKIAQIVTTVFSPVTMSEFDLKADWGWDASAFIVWASWFFYCSNPWFYGHELISIVVILFKVFRLFLNWNRLGFRLFAPRNSNYFLNFFSILIFLIIIASLNITLFSFIIFFFNNFLNGLFDSLEFPQNRCSVISSNRKKEAFIR